MSIGDERKRLIKSIFINSAVLILAINSITTIVTNFIFDEKLRAIHAVDVALDFILLLVVWNLFLRKRFAWRVALIVIALSVFLYYQPFTYVGFNVTHTIEIFSLIYSFAVLLVFQNSFKRRYTNRSIKSAYILAGAGVAIIVVFVAFSNVDDALNIITGDNDSTYGMFASISCWLCMAAAVFLALRPVVIETSINKSEKAFARTMVTKYGQSATSYLALEDDKLLYFGKDVEGVIAYGLVSGVAVVLGDPICSKDEFPQFLSEWREFCRSNEYTCLFLGTTDEYLEIYKMLGYRYVKCGEEARFDLENLGLSGKKKAKMRMNINHANSAGLETFEYKPNEGRDEAIERGIRAVSDDWLGGKKSGQLKFSVGDVNLESPLDRRYFYAKDPSGKIVGFNVFIPFHCMDGYVADVTRRTKDAPGGVTEKLLYDALTVFKEEGRHWGSVGLAPLANVLQEDGEGTVMSKMLNLMYEKGNAFYGFKDLHQTKKRYGAEVWVPGYFVYSGKVLNARMLFAMTVIQSTDGVRDYISSFMSALKKSKSEPKAPVKEENKKDKPAEQKVESGKGENAKKSEGTKNNQPTERKENKGNGAGSEQKKQDNNRERAEQKKQNDRSEREEQKKQDDKSEGAEQKKQDDRSEGAEQTIQGNENKTTNP